jgi:hypothetical protein
LDEGVLTRSTNKKSSALNARSPLAFAERAFFDVEKMVAVA